MTRTALITGTTGRDGPYLAALFRSKGYTVYGVEGVPQRDPPASDVRMHGRVFAWLNTRATTGWAPVIPMARAQGDLVEWGWATLANGERPLWRSRRCRPWTPHAR